MKRVSDVQLFTWRYVFLIFVLIVCGAGLMWRMVDLTVIDQAFLQDQGDARAIRTIETPAYRGMITDRNGEPLAISTPVQSVWANPQDFDFQNKKIPQLARLLNIQAARIKRSLKRAGKREFVYLRRGLAPAKAKKIKALNIPGVNLQREFKRFYPEGEITAHILGFTNVDDDGQEGLELEYNNWLQGAPGVKRVLKDRLGHIVENIATVKEPRPGHNLVLSIDRRIQYLAYRALKKAVTENKAVSGSVVVLDPLTGEVLAMVNQPSYNPNQRPKVHDGRYRNRAVTDVFEPGSVIKAFSIASALDSGKYTPKTMIDTNPSFLKVDGNLIRDDRDNGVITVTQVLKRSSNVGVTKMTISLPPEQLWGLLNRVGFGERTDSGFPGESAGVLVNHRIWRPFVLATLAFGYGISVTPLQLAHGYTVFADKGKLMPVSLLRVNKVPKGKQAMDPTVAKQMLHMLHAVVESGGTGTRARIQGYTVAGKTGTARIAGAHGYKKNHHVATFVGIAPVSKPRLVVAVMINDPRGGKYYGGVIAAPVFADVMEGALRILDVPPDAMTQANNNKQ